MVKQQVFFRNVMHVFITHIELNRTGNTAYQNQTRTKLSFFVTAKNPNQNEPLCLVVKLKQNRTLAMRVLSHLYFICHLKASMRLPI